MYSKVLVPLDGSKLAECVLPHVEELAQSCKTKEVILVSVTERAISYDVREESTQPMNEGMMLPSGDWLVSDIVGKKEKPARDYLGKIAKRLKAKGLKVVTEVLVGNPAEEIVSYTDRAGCDLIIMASHGRSGLSRWAHGSVADKVLQAAPVSILMVKASRVVK